MPQLLFNRTCRMHFINAALLYLVLFPFTAAAKLAGKPLIDSLIKEVETYRRGNDSAKIKLLNKIASSYSRINPDEGIKYGAEALALSKRMDWKSEIAYAYSTMAMNYTARSDYPHGLENYHKALAINEQLNDSYGKTLALNNIANIYLRQNDYGRAREYYILSLAIARKSGYKKLTGTALCNLSAMAQSQDSLELALEYGNAAVATFKDIGDGLNMTITLITIANIYTSQHSYSKAMNTYREVLNANDTLHNSQISSSCYGSMGEMLIAVINDTSAASLNEPLRSAGKPANLREAIKYLDKGIEYAAMTDDRESIVEYRKYLSEAYEMLGNSTEALSQYKQYMALHDSVFSEDSKLTIAKLETQREKSLKERQIEVNALEKNAKKNERLFFMLGMGLISVITVQTLRNSKNQKTANGKLEAANDSLARSNREIAEEKSKTDLLAADLKESIMQKDELTRQLVEAANVKSRFLANISHELRTPVTLFTGMLELMTEQKELYAPGDQEKMKVAYNNSRKLQQMVEEILDLTKMEGGAQGGAPAREVVLNSPVRQVAPLLKRIVYAFETHIQKEGLALGFDDTNAAGLCACLDESLFEKIINNLVYNAIKFNRPGGQINVAIAPSAGAMVEITVSDTGNGISPEDLPHIFERFYQAKTSGNVAGAQGLGIGLSLVREFTEMHGGTVTVSSVPGAGSTFTLKFPMAEHGTEAITKEEIAVLPPENWAYFNRKQTVLLVEDNAEMRYYLREILDEKVNVAETANGNEALAWLEHNTPDLIISDIMMPGMDGREFISRVKSTEAYKRTPVITLSALADKESQIGMLRMGIDDYIVKPFHALELRIRVYNLLYNHAERMLSNAQPAEPDDIPPYSKEAEEFRGKITEYVLSRMKNMNITVTDLATEFHISDRQLSRLAKNLTGCSPAQLIKEVRLQKAYELLLSGDIYKIEDVAKRVGFDTPAYFSKQFFERFGKRPTDFV